MDTVDESIEVVVQRQRRWLAAAVLTLAAGGFVLLAAQVHFLFLMGVPLCVGLIYGAVLGLTNDELLGATQAAMSKDETGMNPF